MTKWDYLIESDAQIKRRIQAFNQAPTVQNLRALLREVRRSHKAIHSLGRWSPPSSSLIFLDLNDEIRIKHDFNPDRVTRWSTPIEREGLAIEHLRYRPITFGIHSRMTKAEKDARVARNERELPYKELLVVPMPRELMFHYVG